MDPPLAFWMAAVMLVAAGALTWRGRRHEPARRMDGRSLLLLAVVFGLAILFFRMGRGLAIFDDRKNLSLISLMAAGEIPPRFYMNPDFFFAYHYAFQLFARWSCAGGLLRGAPSTWPWVWPGAGRRPEPRLGLARLGEVGVGDLDGRRHLCLRSPLAAALPSRGRILGKKRHAVGSAAQSAPLLAPPCGHRGSSKAGLPFHCPLRSSMAFSSRSCSMSKPARLRWG
jgi:hypothetical protein